MPSMYDYHECTPANRIGEEDITVPGHPDWIAGVGVEIEKSSRDCLSNPALTYSQLYHKHGHVLQSDGSVSYGFELATATFNLFGKKFEEEINGILRPYIDQQTTDSAGAHMGLSILRTGRPILNEAQFLFDKIVRGYLCLLYAMYYRRAYNDYCTFMTDGDISLNSGKRHYAICLRGCYIEMRLFPRIKNVNQLLFRLNLLRHIVMQGTPDPLMVVEDLTTPSSDLYILIRSCPAYHNEEKYISLVERVRAMAKIYLEQRLQHKQIISSMDECIKRIKPPKEVVVNT